jgi:glycosyltransferase involved in cell wall biosynthesis
MKILWMSDSPDSPSGFGTVTRFVCEGLARRGHLISILGWQAHGEPSSWGNCTLYPIRHNGFGADVLLNYLRRIQPNILICLADVWWLTFIADPVIASFMRTACIPWALYYPIDGDMGDGCLPAGWVQVLKTVDLPIAMSRYGYDVTLANGVTPAYIAHGVETAVFQPSMDKPAAKRALGYDGAFVVLSDARNQPRKMLPRTLDIFRLFAAGKPDVLLHLHCDPNDPAACSPEYHYNLRADIACLGLEEKVRITRNMSLPIGLPIEQLAAIYQAADVHLLSSLGEGFGLPTLQAASTGVVPLASDYTASRELVQGHGEPVAIRSFISDRFGLRRALIDIDDAVSQLDRLYYDRALLATKARAARAFAEAYDWEPIIAQWHDLLQCEVPRLHTKLRFAEATAQITLGTRRSPVSQTIDGVVQQAISNLPEGVRVRINVMESKAGQLLAGVLRDAAGIEQRLTLPVTLPPDDSAPIKVRTTGRIYIAGPRDWVVFDQLRQIFPGLHAWSSAPLAPSASAEDASEQNVQVVPEQHPSYTQQLASSTLALALDTPSPELVCQAAGLGVPCVGLADHADQAWLWPDLSLAQPNIGAAALLGRWVLTDQGEAARVCAQARARLAESIAMPTGASD